MNLHVATGVTLLVIAGSAAQAELCEDILAIDTQSADAALTLPDTDRVAKCTRSLMLSGGSQMHCGWAFSYRVPDARQAFDDLVNSVTDCLGPAARTVTDQDVNHPDYYDLQTFRLNGREIGVSLKDKAALSKTYVFLRVAASEN